MVLAALRQLIINNDENKTRTLQRYILGLALTAFTYPSIGYLRQGCNLVLDPDKPREFVVISFDGKRQPSSVTHAEAIDYAKAVAKDFGIDPDRTIDMKTLPDREVSFSRELAQKDISDAGETKKKNSHRAKAK